MYQRRRLVALGILIAVLVVLVIGILDGGGEFADAPDKPQEVLSSQRAESPVRFTLSVSGDLLIHSPVYARAASLAGGQGYEFAPLFKQVRPYVKGFKPAAVAALPGPAGARNPELSPA